MTRTLLGIVVVSTTAILAWLIVQERQEHSDRDRIGDVRQVASRLLAAGATDEAAALYEQVLSEPDALDDAASAMAYSLGKSYIELGRYEKALRWFYEAESMGAGELSDQVASGIVNALERLGRHHAAQAALDRRVQLPVDEPKRPAGDPVVAEIGDMEIRLSEVERALDELPPELAGAFAGPEGRERFLDKYVADELIWRKAAKLEYDRDPEVLRRHEEALKQLAVARFVEREILADLEIDETDLRNYFEANRERFETSLRSRDEDEPITYEQARPVVESEYRMIKLQGIYDELIASELATQDVEVHGERMNESS